MHAHTHYRSVVPGVFANQLVSFLDVIKDMLLKALRAQQNEVNYNITHSF